MALAMQPARAFIILWIAWALSWALAALWSRRVEARPSLAAELRYRVPMVIGIVLMLVRAHGYEGALRLWHVGWIGAWVCVALVAAGIAFAWWARLYLGPLWSANITRKSEHRIVDTGPYALVRHPIYTGLLLSLLATTIAKGTVTAIAGFLFLLLGLWLKARLEEGWLASELGEDTYGSYRRRVPMLIPFGPRGG